MFNSSILIKVSNWDFEKGAWSTKNTVSQTQGFCVADFATLSDERRSRSKIFPQFIWIKELSVRKCEGLERSKLLGISQTEYHEMHFNSSPSDVQITLDALYLRTKIRLHGYKQERL